MRTKLGVVALAIVVGACGGAVNNDATGGTPGTPNGGDPSPPVAPPIAEPPLPPPPGNIDPSTLAVRRIFLGETDRAGASNKDAWKSYGRNVDGLVSTRDSTDLCRRVVSASSANQVDGNNGIDNAFGKSIIPFLAPFSAAPSKHATDAIAAGARTPVFLVEKSVGSVAQVGFSHLEATPAPGWGSSTPRSLAAPWTENGGPSAAWEVTVSGDTVRSRSVRGSVTIAIPFGDQTLVLPINVPEIEMSKDGTNGTLSGVVPTEDFIAAFERVAGSISTQLCGGSTLDSIKLTIRQASDILADGTQDPNQSCNGLSIGIGFEAAPVTVAGVADAPAPARNPCQ